jgi:hypothetical protein
MPSNTGGTINRNLKALRVPQFDGNKTTFEEFWCLFESLVDKSAEPVNIKMARFRGCLSGRALEAIRGLGVSEAEYNEAKEIIQSKFGGERRQLRAYMEELEKTPPLRNNDVASFDRFTVLVRVTVAKLRAEGREAELREGSLHGQLVKKLSGQQVESYSRWLNVHDRTPSVVNLCEWLKKEVAIKMEAVEIAHGLEQKSSDSPFKRGSGLRPRTFFTDVEKHGQQKSPCQFCGQSNHPYMVLQEVCGIGRGRAVGNCQREEIMLPLSLKGSSGKGLSPDWSLRHKRLLVKPSPVTAQP